MKVHAGVVHLPLCQPIELPQLVRIPCQMVAFPNHPPRQQPLANVNRRYWFLTLLVLMIPIGPWLLEGDDGPPDGPPQCSSA